MHSSQEILLFTLISCLCCWLPVQSCHKSRIEKAAAPRPDAGALFPKRRCMKKNYYVTGTSREELVQNVNSAGLCGRFQKIRFSLGQVRSSVSGKICALEPNCSSWYWTSPTVFFASFSFPLFPYILLPDLLVMVLFLFHHFTYTVTPLFLVNSDRSSYSDSMLLLIRCKFFRF